MGRVGSTFDAADKLIGPYPYTPSLPRFDGALVGLMFDVCMGGLGRVEILILKMAPKIP